MAPRLTRPALGVEVQAGTQGGPNMLRRAVTGMGLGVMIYGLTLLAALVVGLTIFIVHEDTLVSEYTKLFTSHSDLAPTNLAAIASFHTQSAFAVCQIILTGVLVVATSLYAAVTRRSLSDARKASAASIAAAQGAIETGLRVALALERIAVAAEAEVGRPGVAPEIRSALVLNLGRTKR